MMTINGVELTATELRTLADARDVLRAKITDRANYRVSNAYQAIIDVLQVAVVHCDPLP
jgi:hypothetical protein